MFHFKTDSYKINIMKALATSGGEYSMRSLEFIKPFNRRIMLRNINDLVKQKYISVVGKGEFKRIKILKKGMLFLQENLPDYYEYFIVESINISFRTDAQSINRRFRFGEIMEIIKNTEIPIRFLHNEKPNLKSDNLYEMKDSDVFFYSSKEIKQSSFEEHLKIDFTRLIGVLVNKTNIYPIYNLNKSLIIWRSQSESKMLFILRKMFFKKFKIPGLDLPTGYKASAIMFGKSYKVCYDLLNMNSGIEAKNRTYNYEFLSFNNVFDIIHFISMDEIGIRQLSTLLIPEKINEISINLFNSYPSLKSEKENIFMNGKMLSEFFDVYNRNNRSIGIQFLDGNIAKIKALRSYISLNGEQNEYFIFCNDEQVKFLVDYFIEYKNVKIQKISNTVYVGGG